MYNIIVKSLQREDKCKRWISRYKEKTEKLMFDIKQIDSRGWFENDDEVGVVFDEIVNTIKTYSEETE